MKNVVLCLIAFSVMRMPLVLASMDITTAIPTPEQAMAQGWQAFKQGDFPQAASYWQVASNSYKAKGDFENYLNALVQITEAYQALGQHRRALKHLLDAKLIWRDIDDASLMAAITGSLGKTYFLIGSMDQARKYLVESITFARKAGSKRVLAVSLNNFGSLLASEGETQSARKIYAESIKLSRQIDTPELLSQSLSDAAKAALEDKDYLTAESLFKMALEQTRALEDSHNKVYRLIFLGLGFQQLYRDDARTRQEWLTIAHQTFTEAAGTAASLNDQRTESYAWAYLGQLYEKEQRREEALKLSHRAVFAAQQANAPEILYRWQRQVGRLLATQGKLKEALGAYRQSVHNLQSIRHDLTTNYSNGFSSFNDTVASVFFEFSDLLLQYSETLENPQQIESHLLEARETIERLKAAELEDYFQHECIIALESRTSPLDHIAPQTAAIYPILLEDRTALLLSLPQSIKQLTIPVTRKILTQEVRAFRRKLEKRTTREYLYHAQTLYDWLIRPLETELESHNIKTLIFVPGGALRTIPMAALHDGEQFLVNKYALAITPGLDLTDPRPIERKNLQVMINGLSQSVQGFPALKYVPIELKSIQSLYGGTLLQDEDFIVANLERELTAAPYTVVHIASHAQFQKKASDTFVLTFDGKLTLNRLEQFISLSQYREKPVELLTLSACQTAQGDDRAALGLAGIAIKAGARSTLASLWFISDQASSLLVSEFYRQLKDPTMSKAKALQRAQLSLLDDRRYRHPGYWSPFLLIGNWL